MCPFDVAAESNARLALCLRHGKCIAPAVCRASLGGYIPPLIGSCGKQTLWCGRGRAAGQLQGCLTHAQQQPAVPEAGFTHHTYTSPLGLQEIVSILYKQTHTNTGQSVACHVSAETDAGTRRRSMPLPHQGCLLPSWLRSIAGCLTASSCCKRNEQQARAAQALHV